MNPTLKPAKEIQPLITGTQKALVCLAAWLILTGCTTYSAKADVLNTIEPETVIQATKVTPLASVTEVVIPKVTASPTATESIPA